MQKELGEKWYQSFSNKDPNQWSREDVVRFLERCDEQIPTCRGQKGKQEWIAVKKKLEAMLLTFPQAATEEETSLISSKAAVAKKVKAPDKKNKSRIMYIEDKGDGLIGPARIGRVTLSKTGKTLYYRGQRFQSRKGMGFKSNYFDIETGKDYWISGPRKDGRDRLYGERLPVEIDENVREEYWTTIRKQPQKKENPLAWP